ncbi:MAG: hypothetical protein ACN6O1_13715 [Comamonas sp.]|uniref:hypothetical protein n=1 Tax=Comamonas sp. TaxID=34028 RepID=UPI003D0B7D7B
MSSNPTAPTIPIENLLHASAAGFSFGQFQKRQLRPTIPVGLGRHRPSHSPDGDRRQHGLAMPLRGAGNVSGWIHIFSEPMHVDFAAFFAETGFA